MVHEVRKQCWIYVLMRAAFAVKQQILAIPSDDLQPAVINVPEGLVTAAALGWGTAVALSEPGGQAGGQAGGKLYECRLPSIQTPDSSSQEVCHQAENVPITWCRLPLLRPITAVAVGEHHR